MKRFLKTLLAIMMCGLIAMPFTGCKKLKNRVAKLEELTKEMNSNMQALQTIVVALQNEDKILTIEAIDRVGYVIVFTSGKIITIYQANASSSDNATYPAFGVMQDTDGRRYLTINGSWMLDGNGNKVPEGSGSSSPQFGVKQDTDGKYYWTINGNWMTDASGKKVENTAASDNLKSSPVIGIKQDADGKSYWTVDGEWLLSEGKKVQASGETPKIAIEEGADGNFYWTVNGDYLLANGEKVVAIDGKTDQENTATTFKAITQDDDNVYFTMGDGSIITIGKAGGGNSGNISLNIGELVETIGAKCYETHATLMCSIDMGKYREFYEDACEFGVLYMDSTAYNASGKTLIYNTANVLKVDSCKSNAYEVDVTCIEFLPDTRYYYRAYIRIGANFSYGAIKSFDPYQLPEFVDLGLPSGVLWATCNIGANSPEKYGNYYAWGETSTKSSYTEGNSKTHNKALSTLKSSGIVDANNNLTANYDVAQKKGKGRMPTLTECIELSKKCTSTKTTLYGVEGYKVVGPNGNCIFFPNVGYFSGSDKTSSSFGYSWSATPDANDSRWANVLTFSSNGLGSNYRYFGCTVRPVKK